MKRIFRTKNERMLGGVCGGIGKAFDVDPTVIRLAWALLSLASLGTGILLYIIAWILIPEEGTGGDGETAYEHGE